MSYTLRFSKRAGKDLQRLDLTTARRVLRRLKELSADPFDPVISYSLGRARQKRSSRVGDWRIVYEVKNLIRS